MDTLTSVGFKQCLVEHAVFYRFDEDAMILAVDVDDIIIAGNSPKAVKRFVRDYTLLKLITCHKQTGTRYINQWLFVMTV